jgi:hypothetical protein
MEDWEARSTLFRLLSLDAGAAAAASSPQHAAAAAAALFSPIARRDDHGDGQGGLGGAPMPKGEVHMDEIDLIECIGKGGYG